MAKKEVVSDPFANADRAKVAKATNKKGVAAGQYVRRTFTYLPEQLDMIVQVAQELNMSENDTARWLVDLGLAAYREGERPEVEAKVVKVQPKLRKW